MSLRVVCPVWCVRTCVVVAYMCVGRVDVASKPNFVHHSSFFGLRLSEIQPVHILKGSTHSKSALLYIPLATMRDWKNYTDVLPIPSLGVSAGGGLLTTFSLNLALAVGYDITRRFRVCVILDCGRGRDISWCPGAGVRCVFAFPSPPQNF